MPASEGGIANAFGGKQLVVARDDDAVGCERIGRVVIGIARGIEIVNAAVFFGKAPVPVPTESRSQAEIGAELKFVLEISARLPGAKVAIGVALQEFGGGEIVVRGHEALQELPEVRGRNNALVRSFVARVELSVGIAAAEGEGVLAVRPDSIGGRHDAILKHPGEGCLRGGTLADVDKVVRNGRFPGKNIHDADSGEIGRTKGIDP